MESIVEIYVEEHHEDCEGDASFKEEGRDVGVRTVEVGAHIESRGKLFKEGSARSEETERRL